MNPKRFVYTSIGMTIFVIIPSCLIVSSHFEKKFPRNDYVVTNISGKAFARYDMKHDLNPKVKDSETFCPKSKWICLGKGTKIGDGVIIRSEENASVDIMKKGDIALCINSDSQVFLKKRSKADDCIDVTLKAGNLACRVIQPFDKANQTVIEKYNFHTPNATIQVKGTVFSVDYLPKEERTEVNVIEGLVKLNSKNLPKQSIDIRQGFKSHISPAAFYLDTKPIHSKARNELTKIKRAKIEPTNLDRWEETMDLVVKSPLYKKAMHIITDFEMKIFKRAIIYYGRLCWYDKVPDTLQAIELEDGDYEDPWNTEYFYKKLSAQKAVIISAGEDKILHTNDDIFMSINLGKD